MTLKGSSSIRLNLGIGAQPREWVWASWSKEVTNILKTQSRSSSSAHGNSQRGTPVLIMCLVCRIILHPQCHWEKKKTTQPSVEEGWMPCPSFSLLVSAVSRPRCDRGCSSSEEELLQGRDGEASGSHPTGWQAGCPCLLCIKRTRTSLQLWNHVLQVPASLFNSLLTGNGYSMSWLIKTPS